MDKDNKMIGEAVRAFTQLYTGKRRKDRAAWADYFLSETFLTGYREKDFIDRMLEVVEDRMEEYPPGKEFVTELSIAYGLEWSGSSATASGNGVFDGVEQIEAIAEAGSCTPRFKGSDPAIRAGFEDYRELLSMAPDGDWNDDVLLRLGKILDRYILHNMSDRPIQNARQYELTWRHPGSVRLLTHFFSHTELPDKAYRLLWNHLRLDNATNGREKLLYGRLREIALVHVPALGEKQRVSYKKLLSDFSPLFFTDGNTVEGRMGLDAFFDREDVKQALMDDAFVEEQVLPYWIMKGCGRYLLIKLQEFATAHSDMPFVGQVLEKIDLMRGRKRIEEELAEDEQSGFVWGVFDFQRRAYVRHYLHTAFLMARGVKDPVFLSDYLKERMPVSIPWSRKLIDPQEGGLPPEKPVRILFGEDELSIRFHLKYIEYRWNDSPRVPSFPWEQLCRIEAETEFWLLAPITKASEETYPSVRGELIKRLSLLPVDQDDVPVLADCIAGSICRRGQEEDLWCTVCDEKEEQIFGCDVYDDGTLILYEQTGSRKKPLPGGDQYMPDAPTALRAGKRMLEELTKETSARPPEEPEAEAVLVAQMECWPTRILVSRPYSQQVTLDQGQVTKESVNRLLSEYLDGKIHRLLFAFGGHDLIFLQDADVHKYACFYFDHQKQDWYALVGMPEVYAVVDEKDVVYVPFGLGVRPNYQLHLNTRSIAGQLTDIFGQIACYKPNPRCMMWSPQVYRFETKLRYHLAKRLYGGYPAEQAQNQIADRFYIPCLPVRMAKTDLDGNSTGEREVLKDKAGVQTALYECLKGQLRKLSLTWQYETPEEKSYRHIVILQDEGNYRMIYLDDGTQTVEHLVSDVREYMDADEKKYRKETFLGEKVPGYLVHTDVRRIRDYLDLLISEIRMPSGILGIFGEFSHERCDVYSKAKEKYKQ